MTFIIVVNSAVEYVKVGIGNSGRSLPMPSNRFQPPPKRRIRVLVPNFPNRVQGFIAQELLSLEMLGHELEIYALDAYGNDPAQGNAAAEMVSPIHQPDRNIFRRLLAFVGAWTASRRLPAYSDARSAMVEDLLAARSLMPLVNFLAALTVAQHVNAATDVLYAHFIKHPASVARYVSLMTGVPWVCSAHARDIWTGQPRDLKNKVQSARWIVTCTRTGAEHLTGMAAGFGRIIPIYHGVNRQLFTRFKQSRRLTDGSSANEPVRLLSVGRVVGKKGFPDLLQALALLPPSVNWTFRHIGPGLGVGNLKRQADRLGIGDRTDFAGQKMLRDLVDEYRKADIFVLPCLVDRDGDMDGMPNALAEAASQGLACVTTSVSEIPQLFSDGVNALLVPPRDPPELARAVVRLIAEPSLRHRLGQAAATTIAERFDHQDHVRQLSQLFCEIE